MWAVYYAAAARAGYVFDGAGEVGASARRAPSSCRPAAPGLAMQASYRMPGVGKASGLDDLNYRRLPAALSWGPDGALFGLLQALPGGSPGLLLAGKPFTGRSSTLKRGDVDGHGLLHDGVIRVGLRRRSPDGASRAFLLGSPAWAFERCWT